MTTRLDWSRVRQELGPGAELIALWGLAYVQPVLDVFGQSPETFVAARAGTNDIVAFAVLGALLVPLALWAGAAAIGWAAPSWRGPVQVALVGGLGSLVALRVLHELFDLAPAIHLAAGLTGGALLAVAHVRWSGTRAALCYLVIAPVAFVALFLFGSPVHQLLTTEGGSAAAAGSSSTPVVMVVLDELPLATLLDGTGQVDEELFPNFARLAGSSTWYRNTTTVNDETKYAVPSIVTGLLPDDKAAAPTAANHPRSLFSLFGGSHMVEAAEYYEVCAREICGASEQAEHPLRDLTGQAADLWTDLLGAAATGPAETGQFDGPDVSQHEDEVLTDFVAGLDGRDPGLGPRFDFAHVLVPHSPWQLLPDGTRYADPSPSFGIDPDTGLWESQTAADLARRRQVLQTMRVDAHIGRLIDRLVDTGQWDEAVVVVTADHGVSFTEGHPGRDWTEATATDLMWVPLFVKAPGQETGVVDDTNVLTIDIAPTVAELAGVAVPWEIDGRSVLSEPRSDGDKPIVYWGNGPETQRRVVDGPSGLAAVLASGPSAAPADRGPVPRAYLADAPTDRLVGRAPPARPGPTGGSASIDQQDQLDAVNPGDPLPAYVSGAIERLGGADGTHVAIVVNGTVAAVERLFEHDGINDRFATMIAPDLLVPGANDVRVHLVDGNGTFRPLD